MGKKIIISIDVEGDNLWERATLRDGIRNITTQNAKYLGRFQSLCNKYGFIPTYLTDYEMIISDYFCHQAKEWVQDGLCEIGMHMHSWNTPPIYLLPFHKRGHNPYAGEYPHRVMWEKLKYLTEIIENKIEVAPTSHRGGRWYIDKWYIHALKKLGYTVDCSITPGVNWKNTIGNRTGGPDYSSFPNKTFFMDKDKQILQIPPTIIKKQIFSRIKKVLEEPYDASELMNQRIWLRPTGNNLADMLYIVKKIEHGSSDYIEFMIHSSELMPGGSPNFKTASDIDKLYFEMDILFNYCEKNYEGISMREYCKSKKE